MANYRTVNGVRTWYDELGTGEPVVLLHGGFSNSRDFHGNLADLADDFHLLLPERRGHGHTADVPGPITVELMAQDAIAFVEDTLDDPTRLVGYSAGGIVALWVALRRPDLVSRLALISAAFDVSGTLFRPSADAEPPAPLVAAYAEVSPDGADHFPVVFRKIVDAVETEPGLDPAQLGAVSPRTLVMAGDDDLVTLEHTIELYRGLPNAELAIVPAASHLLLHEKPALCTSLVRDFLTTDQVPTMMPIRRAR
jgi:pimeloyl-ACP methyl ester carboxylesterase